ncbi:pimeloyl-ACP methyl ester carboxylesterase [Deinobacterium chartae]|uniref:Pimeloyl-ACP methyl ester carboxylesterase n=1 Tax=Deinobacterium chartae TaxID=521158 RepID=A0A841I364_9DEIO|nr:alpha/beta fold hydrolase [Deinobacterium chartae]MBB6098799.1 pimeloyl-ACP methyl ester carboxylesterase [Deinobacterium chartae]
MSSKQRGGSAQADVGPREPDGLENLAVQRRHRVVNGVRLYCLEAGREQDPPVLLLHGFPEDGRAWKHQVAPLVRAGLRVVVPDLRGYHRSEKPPGVAAYRLEELTADVAALIQALGGRADVVGHDWGGIVAWNLAVRWPERVRRLVILNAPHPAAVRRALRMPAQWCRSWYVLFFQLPVLPEILLRRAGPRAFASARPGAYGLEDLQGYQRAWQQPGTATAMIHYYRALLRYGAAPTKTAVVLAPTLLVWGQRDMALVPQLADHLEAWVPDLRVVRLPRASHWVMRDEPLVVTQLLLEHLGE